MISESQMKLLKRHRKIYNYDENLDEQDFTSKLSPSGFTNVIGVLTIKASLL